MDDPMTETTTADRGPLTDLNQHGLLEGTAPVTSRSRYRLQQAEWRTFIVAAIGSVGTLAALLGPIRLDPLSLGPPAVGLTVVMTGMMALYLEKWPDRLVRLVLFLGALALVTLGLVSIGHVSPHRLIIGCFAPALLFGAAGVDLVLSRRAPGTPVTS
jgi:hypothetical protein